MNYLYVSFDYVIWWYSGGLKRLYLWLRALFGWISNYFSIGRVFKTLFSPWKRLIEERKPGLDGLGQFLIDNLISRLVGLIMRLAIIILYVFVILGLSIFSIACYIFWIFWPLILLISFIAIFN